MKKILLVILLCVGIAHSQTTTVNLTTTPVRKVDRFGMQMGSLAGFGNEQSYKDLFYAVDGYATGIIAATTFACSTGGTTQTTTNYYTGASGSANPYPANFWVGATFDSRNATTGASYGTGTISASTNNASTGISFTLGTATSSPCNPSNHDVMIVRQLTTSSYYTPAVMASIGLGFQLSGGCGGAIYNTSDTSPASTNTIQSLQLPTGCTETLTADQVLSNPTDTNGNTGSRPWINLNGNYNATFKAKCTGGSGSLIVSLQRISGTVFISPTTETLTCNNTAGAGWTTFNIPFTATETNSQTTALQYSFAITGTVLVQDQTAIEGSTLAGNTTVFRDAWVQRIKDIHPGSIRGMSPALWGSTVADETAAIGNRRWSANNAYTPNSLAPAYGFSDILQLGEVVGADVFLNVGCFNTPSEWSTLVTWLSTQGYTAAYAATGNIIYLENCNEAWNTGAGGSLWYGNGFIYGNLLGNNVAAAKAATGYNAAVVKIVGNSWFASGQSDGPFGWMDDTLTTAAAVGSKPDYLDIAPYTFSTLGSFTTSGSSVGLTGEPWSGMFAQIANFDSAASTSGFQSVIKSVQETQSLFGIPLMVYETNANTQFGITVTQLQLNQIAAGMGAAVSEGEHWMLMQRDAELQGPIHVFDMGEQFNGYVCNIGSCGGSTGIMPLWGTERYISTGPGQTPDSATVGKPISIMEQVLNNAEGGNNWLMSSSQTGTPTYSYPGGQSNGTSNTITSNSTVNYVNCGEYSDTLGHYTVLCFNVDPAASHAVNFTGTAAPVGTVVVTALGPSNLITDENENSFNGPGSLTPLVTLPTSTNTSGTTFTLAPASAYTFQYSTSGGIPTTSMIIKSMTLNKMTAQ